MIKSIERDVEGRLFWNTETRTELRLKKLLFVFTDEKSRYSPLLKAKTIGKGLYGVPVLNSTLNNLRDKSIPARTTSSAVFSLRRSSHVPSPTPYSTP